MEDGDSGKEKGDTQVGIGPHVDTGYSGIKRAVILPKY